MNRFEVWVHERDPDAEPELVESLDDRRQAIDHARAIARLGDPVKVWENDLGDEAGTCVFDSETGAA